MKRQCPQSGCYWAWKLKDGRFKCRNCKGRYTFKNLWDSFRIPERQKRKLLEYFVLGVPVYRLRFRIKVSDETIKKFFRAIRGALAIAEECYEPFKGTIECDETMFGGRKAGKRDWGASGKIIVFGILQRNGKIRVFPNRKGELVKFPLISLSIAIVSTANRKFTHYGRVVELASELKRYAKSIADRSSSLVVRDRRKD